MSAAAGAPGPSRDSAVSSPAPSGARRVGAGVSPGPPAGGGPRQGTPFADPRCPIGGTAGGFGGGGGVGRGGGPKGHGPGGAGRPPGGRRPTAPPCRGPP